MDIPGMAFRKLAVAAAVLLVALGCGQQQSSGGGAAEKPPGVTDTEILLGSTFPLSGTASFYAAVARGADAYFKYVNDQGGVNGRKINFKVLDDAYDPSKTPALTRQLVEEDKIFAAFGTLGTPPNSAVRPYYNEKKVPQMFVFTGASKWGGEYKKYPWTIGWQPDYVSEAKIYAKDILKNSPNAKIGILYQNDAYGKDLEQGFKDGLGGKATSMIVDEETYEANAADVKSQVASLKNKGADLFLIVCTPTYAIQALVTASTLGWKPTIYVNQVANSQVVMKGAIKALGGSNAGTDGVISTAYLKDPTDAKWDNDKGMQQYRQVLAKYCPSCDVNDGFHIAGMGAAFTMVDVLKKAGKDLTRQKVMDQARNLNEPDNPFVLPGIRVQTSGDQQFPIHQAQLEKYMGGKWELVGSVIDSRK
jgi:branched-chain amino acid transport system substrate-binding protein